MIYDYLKTNFGIVKTYNNQDLKEKYSNFPKRQLRNELKRLKKENTDRNAIVLCQNDYVQKFNQHQMQT